MKAILGSLLCFVLFASQCFAISGGPPYPGGTTSLVGTYAGVMQPAFDPTDPFSSNSLGLFTVGVPTDGASTGQFVIFARGRVYGGTIQGVTDPSKAKLSALLSASFSFMETLLNPDGTVQRDPITGEPVVVAVTATVEGPLTASISTNTNSLSSSSALLTGSATAFISNGRVSIDGNPVIEGTLSLEVMGFKQSNTAPASGVLTPPTG